jgi:hypothetical protein
MHLYCHQCINLNVGTNVSKVNSLQQLVGERITCKRVSAKRSVKDDFAFLWEHASFSGYPPNENPLTDRSEILHIDYIGGDH